MANKRQEFALLESALVSLVGERCWSVINGEGSGSLVSTAFGKKLLRKLPLRNASLSDEQRNFEGEFELYVECAWRLESKEEVLCTSTSSNHRGGLRDKSLRNLIGRTVTDAVCTYPGGDLAITFDDSLALRIFVDQANEVDEFCNYTFATKDLLVTNAAKAEIKVQRKSSK
jgi:hypothetical protein